MTLNDEFFHCDCLELAPKLIGKIIIRSFSDGREVRLRICETEAYRGEEDKACHASKGRTARTETLYRESGVIYVYLCYGIHWLLNIVSGEREQAQAVLIRACEDYVGPRKLTKKLGIDKSFNGEKIVSNPRICIEDDGYRPAIRTDKRVGIDYAGEEWINKPWRFIAENI